MRRKRAGLEPLANSHKSWQPRVRLRALGLASSPAGTGVPDGRAAGRADGCLRTCHASPTPGSRESRWNRSRRCCLLCVASGWVSSCEAVGEMARGLRHAGELLAATICASLRAARGPHVCGARGARPRSRFTVDLSGGDVGGDRSKSCTERGGMQQLCAKFRASDFACGWLPD